MIKALLFDFDGLIIDTETPDFQSWVEVYEAHNATLTLDKWSSHVGGIGRFNPYQYLEDQIGREVDRRALRDQRSKRFNALCKAQPILPGVMDMIHAAKARNMSLAIASNSFGKWVNKHLERLKLTDLFDVVISLDQITIGKPEPKMYQTAAYLLRVRPEEAIAFEDSPAGAMGAKRAQIYTIAIPNPMTAHLDFSHCDRVVNSMAELDMDEMIETASQPDM